MITIPQLAKCLQQAASIHENSWYDNYSDEGDSPRQSGRYTKSICSSLRLAIQINEIPEQLFELLSILLDNHWNETTEWAERQLQIGYPDYEDTKQSVVKISREEWIKEFGREIGIKE